MTQSFAGTQMINNKVNLSCEHLKMEFVSNTLLINFNNLDFCVHVYGKHDPQISSQQHQTNFRNTTKNITLGAEGRGFG